MSPLPVRIESAARLIVCQGQRPGGVGAVLALFRSPQRASAIRGSSQEVPHAAS
jgi:hypothetical protein